MCRINWHVSVCSVTWLGEMSAMNNTKQGKLGGFWKQIRSILIFKSIVVSLDIRWKTRVKDVDGWKYHIIQETGFFLVSEVRKPINLTTRPPLFAINILKGKIIFDATNLGYNRVIDWLNKFPITSCHVTSQLVTTGAWCVCLIYIGTRCTVCCAPPSRIMRCKIHDEHLQSLWYYGKTENRLQYILETLKFPHKW